MDKLLYVLPSLACPIGMGVMMWMMMKPKRGAQPAAPPALGQVDSADPDIVELREQVAGLREQLDRRDTPAAEHRS